jgi:hypothetical protein
VIIYLLRVLRVLFLCFCAGERYIRMYVPTRTGDYAAPEPTWTSIPAYPQSHR